MVVFYENAYAAANLNHFGLKNMGLRQNVEELEWDEKTMSVIDAIF
jgi:hypothetical protein